MKSIALVVTLAGCDVVFSTPFDSDDAPPTDDAQPLDDARLDDAAADAREPTCWTDGQRNFDEDNDNKVDGCDNCPHISNELQDDDDGDGVGNACDPSVEIQHRIALFRGFHETSELAELSVIGTGWRIVDDKLVQSATVTFARAELPVVATGATVDVIVSGIPMPTVTRPNTAGVAASVNGANELECGASRAMEVANDALFFNRNGDVLSVNSMSAPIAAQLRILLNVVDLASEPACHVDNGANDRTLRLSQIGPLTGSVVLFTENGPASFAHVFVAVPQ